MSLKEQIQKLREDREGFTLAELLIVVAIIMVLVAIAIPVFTSSLHASQDATEIANARSLYADLQADYLANATNDDYDGAAKALSAATTATLSDGQTLEFSNGTLTVAFTDGKGYTVTWTADSGCPANNDDQVWGAQ